MEMLLVGASRPAHPFCKVHRLGWSINSLLLFEKATREKIPCHAITIARCLAHGKLLKPKPRPRYSIEEACEILTEKSKLRTQTAAYEFAVKMNLGPGMPKTSKDHKLKGVFIFPHGLGKKPLKVAAITSDPDLAIAAYQAGARYAGDLGDSIRRGFVPLRALDRLVATDEMIEVLNRRDNRVAKKLHKYKMTPNYTSKTLCKPEDFVDSVKAHVNGRYHKFVISSRGLIICPVGTITGSTPEQVRMNVEYVLRYLYAIQPPTFGLQKFRKKKNLGKYVLGIHLGASQLPGVPLSLKSLLHDTGIDRTGKYAVEWETD